jgi:hypothetical protein
MQDRRCTKLGGWHETFRLVIGKRDAVGPGT